MAVALPGGRRKREGQRNKSTLITQYNEPSHVESEAFLETPPKGPSRSRLASDYPETWPSRWPLLSARDPGHGMFTFLFSLVKEGMRERSLVWLWGSLPTISATVHFSGKKANQILRDPLNEKLIIPTN